MASDSNQDNNQRNHVSDETNNSKNSTSEKKPLTFKDWKTLKDSQKKNTEKSQNNKNCVSFKSRSRTICNYNGSNYSNNTFNRPRTSIVQGVSSFSPRLNNYNSIFDIREACFETVNNGFNKFNNNNNNNNNINIPNNFEAINFNNRFKNANEPKNCTKPNVLNNVNSLNESNNLDLPEGFFAFDGIYRQKDFMQKPLVTSNPFRNEQEANQLLQGLDKKKKVDKTQAKKSSNKNDVPAIPDDIKKISNEPKVYVPNPKAKIDGKPYIPKPKLPEQNLEITKEEKKQQWKEYREAMKPFKNREFYNAKRVVQRLGKKAPGELDEKEVIRLTNARVIMESHKARLSAKYANYIKSEHNSNELGELYVLKKTSQKSSDLAKPTTKQLQNYGNFGESNTYNEVEFGRKIIRDYTNLNRFVSGGILEGTVQKLSSQ